MQERKITLKSNIEGERETAKDRQTETERQRKAEIETETREKMFLQTTREDSPNLTIGR